MKSYNVHRFDVPDTNYYVEITPVKDYYEFTLCKESCGFKSFTFGLSQKDCPPHEWVDMILANVYDYIDGYEEDLEHLEYPFDCDDACPCSPDGMFEPPVFEAIDMHNEHVDKMQELAEALLAEYPDIEDTPVSKAFCEAFDGLMGNAIYLCCEANRIDEDRWVTTEDWHVICED